MSKSEFMTDAEMVKKSESILRTFQGLTLRDCKRILSDVENKLESKFTLNYSSLNEDNNSESEPIAEKESNERISRLLEIYRKDNDMVDVSKLSGDILVIIDYLKSSKEAILQRFLQNQKLHETL